MTARKKKPQAAAKKRAAPSMGDKPTRRQRNAKALRDEEAAAEKPQRRGKPVQQTKAERQPRVIVKIEYDYGGGSHGETSLAWRRLPGHEAVNQLMRMIERALVACGGVRIWKPSDEQGWRDAPDWSDRFRPIDAEPKELQLELSERGVANG